MSASRTRERVPVTLLCHSLSGGGAEKIVSNILSGLDRRKFTLSLTLAAPDIDFEIPADVTIHILNQDAKGILARQRALASHWSRYPPGVVISHGTTVNVDAIFARRMSESHFPVICVEHSVFSEVTKLQHPGIDFASYRRIVKYACGKADAVVAVSAGCADDLTRVAGIPPGKVEVIPNPVITSSLRQAAARPCDHPWFTGTAHAVVAGMGRLIPEKRFTDLVGAFSVVARSRSDARLVILGRGPERDALAGLAESLGVADRVSLPGFSDNPYPALCRASVFVHPSLTEAMPNVLIEAIALGVPVIASRISGNAELLCQVSQAAGNLVDPGDVPGLAAAIFRALNSPSSCRVPVDVVAAFDEAVAIAAYERLVGRVVAAGVRANVHS